MAGIPSDGTASVSVSATLGSCQLNVSVTVPAGPTRLDELLPLLQILSDRIVASAEEESQRQGRAISCRKGCGACCRQLVPISPVEARHIARLVAAMPEPRKTEIQGRFAAARQRLESAGLWQRLKTRQAWPEAQVPEIGLEYFRQGVSCPFLEDESCSIHPDRPMACREYLVTSPAENCASPTPQSVEWLPLPAKVWTAAARCEPGAAHDRYLNWVPLIQSLDWADGHPEPPPDISGPELVRKVFERLADSPSLQRDVGTTASLPDPSLEHHA